MYCGKVILLAKPLLNTCSRIEFTCFIFQSIICLKFTNGDYIKLSEPLTDGPISPHDKLDILFQYYQKKFSINEACRKSFKNLLQSAETDCIETRSSKCRKGTT